MFQDDKDDNMSQYISVIWIPNSPNPVSPKPDKTS